MKMESIDLFNIFKNEEWKKNCQRVGDVIFTFYFDSNFSEFCPKPINNKSALVQIRQLAITFKPIIQFD